MVQAFLKKWWVESDFKAPNLPLSLRRKCSGCHYNSIYNNTICLVASYFVYVFIKCIYVYWYEARFSFQIRFMLFNRYMTCVISRVGISYSAHLFRFLCCVFCFVCLRPVSCLSECYQFLCIVLISPSVFSNVYIIAHVMYAYLMISSFYMNRIGVIMVNVLAASAVLDHWFESRSDQTKVF